jgi:hypothetical protein
MFTSDSQPIIADSEYEVTKVLVKKDMHANRDILLLLKLQLAEKIWSIQRAKGLSNVCQSGL